MDNLALIIGCSLAGLALLPAILIGFTPLGPKIHKKWPKVFDSPENVRKTLSGK